MNAFWRGVASIFDFGGSLSNYPIPRPEIRPNQTPEEAAQADADAIASDWAALGRDFDMIVPRVPGEGVTKPKAARKRNR